MRIIVSGGGTGGHIYPAIAIIQELKNRVKDLEVLYVGTNGGLEEDIVTNLGIDFKSISSMGIPRKVSSKLFKSIVKNFKGLGEAKKIIKEFKPDIVIGTGGYVCAAVLYKASKMKIPTVVHESNSYPGMANKFLSKYVDRVLISYEECRKYFKYQNKIINTGNPIRNNFIYNVTDKDYKDLNIKKNIPVVFSFGGSNGSYYLNEAVKGLSSLMDGKFYLLHATGKKNYEDMKKEMPDNEYIRLFPYIDDIQKFYAISDLIIASSGAMTLTEISSLKKASILIPKGYTTENHQQYNAKTYKDNGASEMILEKDLNFRSLYDSIINIVSDKEKLKLMGENAGKLSNKNVSKQIADIIIELSKK
ncbi:MAG: undecaprenyldiphospho-muramoylpentapeptide beta-N-acetylglucosaminyltransferase [Tissierellia bacterium]|nr:undecaprenyldiphospho-muramoylpentapeptide beta-N-acetylglucosaminyltransferase [Tissierellia bacterium]